MCAHFEEYDGIEFSFSYFLYINISILILILTVSQILDIDSRRYLSESESVMSCILKLVLNRIIVIVYLYI